MTDTRGRQMLAGTVALDVQILKSERDRLKEVLREIETETRRVEADLKSFRQREIQTKREIEALTVLIDLSEGRETKKENDT
ncbi:MAG TPA: hypothetical protein VGJ84_01340 [Polyangiaceae bacterium]